MWVLKIGGSLADDALLREWLTLAATAGAGRIVVVPGGGRFADVARETQAHWQLDDLPAHNMAVLAMVQTGLLFHALAPGLQLADSSEAARQRLKSGHSAIWLPYERLRSRPDASTHWGCTSDSLALELARSGAAERVMVVKRGLPPDPLPTRPADWQTEGWVDSGFAERAAGLPCPIMLLRAEAPQRLRTCLMGRDNPPTADALACG